MKRFFFLLFLSLVLAFAITSCSKTDGKGDLVTETRVVGAFNGVNLSMEATVYVSQDSIYSLRVQAQENLLDIIETPVESGSLVIRVKNHHVIGSHEPITVFVSAPDISKLNISGSGDIKISQGLEQYSVDMTISGSGNIDLPVLYAHEIETNISGSGNIYGRGGGVDYAHHTISGSGNIEFSGVSADSVYATISGSGDIKVTANKLLDATISGSGNIRYYGTPVVIPHISGSGEIGPL